MQENNERWIQRFSNFEKAYKVLEQYVDESLTSDLERAGFIQLFEVAFELSWKVMKDYLESEGFVVSSPCEAIKQAFQTELINSGHIWIDALTDRNLTVHTYDEDTAKKIVNAIRTLYFPEIQKFYFEMAKRI